MGETTVNMDSMDYSTSMYSGKTDDETYSSTLSSAVSGSYYEHIKEKVAFWLDEIIQRKDQNGQIAIVDYGTADGIGFLSMINSLLDKHLRSMRGIDIMIFLNDQPSNDFNLLIKGITGPATSNLKSGLGLSENISVAVIGRNMYERCLPKNSLDICFSSIALHFLSRKPCNATNGLSYKDANKEEEKAFEEQAKQDWHQFLVSRGKELKDGGLCVVLSLCCPPDDDDIYPFAPLTQIWKHLVTCGLITKEEFVNTTLQVYMRRPEDFNHPFNNDDPEIIALGLELLSSNGIIHQCTEMTKNYLESDEESRKKYADAVVGCIQTWLRNTIHSGLATERSEVSRNEICDEFFKIVWDMAYKKEIKMSHFCLQQIVIRKRQKNV